MKKIITLAFLTLFIYSVNAQKYSGGLVFAPNLAWFNPDSKIIENQGVKLGFHFGLVGDYNFSKNVAFSTGLLIQNLYGSLKYDSAINFKVSQNYPLKAGAQIDYKLKYIEIPLNIKFKTNEIGYLTYFLQAGLNPYFRVGSKASANQLNISDENISKEVSFVCIGYNVGGGVLYSLGGNTALMAAIIYTNGFSDVTSNYSVYMNNLALRIGIVF